MDWISFLIGAAAGAVIFYILFLFNKNDKGKATIECEKQLSVIKAENSTLQSDSDKYQAEIENKEQGRLESALADCKAELENNKAEKSSLEADLGQCNQKLKSCEVEKNNINIALQNCQSELQSFTSVHDTIEEIGSSIEPAAVPDDLKPNDLKSAKLKLSDSKPDDLKEIEGIGPKVSRLLNEGGIFTFQELAHAGTDSLKQILKKAGSRYKMINPATWPEQAELAAKGDWDALQKLQDKLYKGEYVIY